MPKPVSCHWTNDKALPGRNKYFYLTETDEKAPYLAAWYLIRPQTAKSLDRAVPQFILNPQTLLKTTCVLEIFYWHMEQWPTQVTCNHPGGTSNLPCEAMAHSHK